MEQVFVFGLESVWFTAIFSGLALCAVLFTMMSLPGEKLAGLSNRTRAKFVMGTLALVSVALYLGLRNTTTSISVDQSTLQLKRAFLPTISLALDEVVNIVLVHNDFELETDSGDMKPFDYWDIQIETIMGQKIVSTGRELLGHQGEKLFRALRAFWGQTPKPFVV